MKIYTLLLLTGLAYIADVNSHPIVESCICPALYQPVCGSDGNIYDNDCLLNCENKRRQKLGLPQICNLGAPSQVNDDPCDCPKIYKPVCGSDGKVYDNDCLLNCENKRRQKLGLPQICNLGAPSQVNDDPCDCPKIYKPVCGSDGKVYDNDCLLNCENKRRQKLGLPQICNLGDYTEASPKPCEECICPAIYRPVCGLDGKIYDNDCLLNCENKRRQKLGLPQICNLGDYTEVTPKPCEECICPAVYRPVCGSDGKIYDNDCLLNCENKRRQKLGLPQICNLGAPSQVNDDPCDCPKIYKPVCGSDGKVYDNDCLLNCENKRRQKLGLPQICNLGDYTEAPPKPCEECICPAIYRPVCGSDGKIYDNDCLLNCENKRRQKLGLPQICNLGDYTEAPPKPCEECICPAIYRPVCGSDGKIYDNDCLLNCENKRRQKLGLPQICNLGDYTEAQPKPCEECICPAIYRPVCGSDGKIYDNDCLLNCENKRRQKLGLPLICNLGDYTEAPPVVDNESCICPLLYRPVYGSDGKIYSNECELNCEIKRRQNCGVPPIHSLGEYNPQVCH